VSDDGHTCSYHCDRQACIKAQRDELRDEVERLRAEGGTIVAFVSDSGQGAYIIKGFDIPDDTPLYLRPDPEVAKLRAENERLRADAARYRWLRDIGDSTWIPMGKRPGISFTHQIDDSIDAAIKAKQDTPR
jgi:hypothetical protein